MSGGRKKNELGSLMAVFDLFSKRQRRLRGDVPEVYQYDTLPEAFRVQVIHMWIDGIGSPDSHHNLGPLRIAPFRAYSLIADALRREYGVFTLAEVRRNAGDFAFVGCLNGV